MHWPQTDAQIKSFVSNPREVGANLFQALFKDDSPAQTEFDALSKQSERTIALALESPELDGIAWEYAYNQAKEEYVVEDCAFVRALPEKERPANGRMKNEVERVPLLFIPANPLVDLSGEPLRALDEEKEWQTMKGFIEKSNAPFDLIELRPATPEALQSVMARFQHGMIAHFSGHGAATKDGTMLLFERENGASNPLAAREFVREIKDKAWIGFLSACQSAVAERTEFSNLARELAKAGVPFALGMQFNLPDPFAPNISGQFYNYLAHGHAAPEAARQARRAVKRENEFYVGMIALYAAHPDEVGILRQAQDSWRGSGAQTHDLFRPADVNGLPSPASGLIGRQRELMRIGTQLLEGKKPQTVTLHGAGGIGKTALLRETLLRFAPSFDLTLAIGLDPLPSLESVLGQIEKFLEWKSPCADETREREALVREALTKARTLLGLDNFETLNHALNEEGSENENTAKSLHEFFSGLCAEGVRLCVTSREPTDLPSEELVEIYGLEETYGGSLFREFAGSRKDTLSEAQAQETSAAVGGHPLALQLLGAVYKNRADLNPKEFLSQIQSLLAETRNKWGKTKRHISLEECFAFSLDNLPKNEEGKELQIGISRLSVFVSFFAAYMVAPTLAGKWPEDESDDESQQRAAQKSVHALWERGLLERLTLPLQNENFYLYRLHPALGQFAADRVLPEDLPAMQETHFRAMRQLASRSYPTSEGGGIYGSPLRSTIARVAMPDMLKAAQLKQDQETSTLLYHLAFLNTHFGDLDGAMKLYQQAREILEGLGDLKGKSATLINMGVALFQNDRHAESLSAILSGLQILIQLGAKLDIETVIGLLRQFQQAVGAEAFAQLWKQVTDSEELPEWLA
ncbi:MAG: CHAT domain-containing protein [Anaerolineales bacterium]|nr:CHAT domain-containing protein [Anaerolineales bacterium]